MSGALDEGIFVRVSQEDREAIKKKMEQSGITNQSAYIRKMAVDGYVIVLDLSDVKEMVRLLSINSNNLNQIAKKANQTGSIYIEDINKLRTELDGIWNAASEILVRLSGIK